jgi:phenylpropionate dioxygenase-like ring-hydroxylating dioxygenase large terminal subunit
MSTKIEDDYIPGTSKVPSYGTTCPQDRKSLPLSVGQPHRERYLNIDPARYTSTEEMRRERDLLWPKAWMIAGLAVDLPSVGSWFRYDVGGESFVVARSDTDEFSAFYNVCQHRGNRIVAAEFGKQPAFVCTYHSWTYDLRGKIKRITDRKFFDERALCGKLDAPQVRCEVWAGIIFICMDESAAPLAEYLGELPELLAAYHLEKMFIVRDVKVELDCNWKVVMDAFSEAYHIHMTHPQVLPLVDEQKVQLDFFKGGHGRIITALGMPSSRVARSESLNPGLEFLLRDSGIDPETFTGSACDVRRACQLAKRQRDNVFGLDYSEFSDNQLTDSWVIDIFPNTQWTLHPEGALVQRFLPHRSDPGKCVFHVSVLIPKMKEGRRPPFYMGVGPDVDISGTARPTTQHVRFDDPQLKDLIGELLWQDVANMIQCQRGMESRGFKAIRLSEQEQIIQHRFCELDRYLNPGIARSIQENQ